MYVRGEMDARLRECSGPGFRSRHLKDDALREPAIYHSGDTTEGFEAVSPS